MSGADANAGANERLSERIRAGDTDALRALWEVNKGLVRHIAKRYAAIFSGRGDCDIDDLMQAGFIGLRMAAVGYLPHRGASFATYAVFHIRREMRRALGIYSGKRDAAQKAISLDAPLSADGDATLRDTVADDSGEQFKDCIEEKELVTAVRSAVAHMKNDRNRRAIIAYYFDGTDTVRHAESEGVSVQCISTRLFKGYIELRRNSTLIRWAVDYGYINPYRQKGVRAFNTTRSSIVEDFVIEAANVQSETDALRDALGDLA